MIKGPDMDTPETQETLRETISQAVNDVESGKTLSQDAPPINDKESVKTESKEDSPKPGRTAGRARDESGKLLPGKAEKPDTKPETVTTPERKPIKIRDRDIEYWNKPSTWKKELEAHWGKLPDEVMQEIHRRESDAAFGVSTYKAEYDQYKPIAEAFKPYQPFLQQNNITPDRYAKALMETDQVLRFGTPQQKLQNFVQLSQIYGIPLHEMFVQGEDGKVYFNQQHMSAPQQASQQQAITREDIRKMLDEERSNAYWAAQIKSMQEAKDSDGNLRYPHFETLRMTMDGILRSGLAKDLNSAYDAAIRLPQHADLYDAQQNAKREAEEKAKTAAKQQQTARAKDAAVSVKSQSPTSEVKKAQNGRISVRASLEDAFDQIESGRV